MLYFVRDTKVAPPLISPPGHRALGLGMVSRVSDIRSLVKSSEVSAAAIRLLQDLRGNLGRSPQWSLVTNGPDTHVHLPHVHLPP